MKRAPLLLAAAALCLYWWMATSVSDLQCTTGDEIAHLTAGYSYWTTDDYRLQPENGNLPQRWAALPLLGRGLKFPTLDQDAWRISDVWDLGFQWFYDCGNDLASMLRAGRRMIALFGVATELLVFLWARRLHGDRGALLAVGLFAFCPTMLANGALITSDMAAACMFLVAVTAFWAMAHRLTLLRLAAFGAALGLLCVAKFSAPLVAPMCALLFAVRVAGRPTLEAGWPHRSLIAGRLRVALHLIGATLAACALAVAVIWASYGFKYPMYRHFEPNRVRSLVGWDVLEDQGGPPVAVFRFVRAHQLLPESYIYGFAHTYRFSRYRKAFLNGEYRSTGWVQFFPYTTAVKTPLALFGLIGLAGLGAAARRRSAAEWGARLYAWSPLLSLFAVYWAFSLTSGLNIGHRHIIPIYPVLFVMAAGAAAWVGGPPRWAGACVAALAAWFAAESVWIRPHYLAYFNELVGPRDAWRHVVDSSLDWGQDLPGLKAWLEANRRPGEDAFLAYFGTGEPRYYRLPVKRLAYINGFHEDEPYIPLGPGLYCVGATMLQQVYGVVRGPWTVELEKEYQFLRAFEPMFRTYAEDPAARARLERDLPPEKWAASRDRFLHLRFARLCYFLRVRRPDALIGYSIFVYRLSAQEVRAATAGTLSEWSALIVRSGDANGG
jgi:hypothetical protein